MSTETFAPVVAGTKIVIVKGCRARTLQKGDRGTVVEVIPGERGSARVRISFAHAARRHLGEKEPTAVIVSFYVQHTNRLADGVIGMNDGNPMHRIEVRRA